MKTYLGRWVFLATVLGALPIFSGTLSGQEARHFFVGLTAGPGAVQVRGRDDSWDVGPIVGGRVEWGGRRSVAYLTVDVQPFRGEGATAGDFRALYLLPYYAVGSGGRRIGFGVGMGVFDFEAGTAKDGIEVGFVTGASGSARINGSYSVELGWKRIQNVRGLRANVWSLQLVRRWRL